MLAGACSPLSFLYKVPALNATLLRLRVRGCASMPLGFPSRTVSRISRLSHMWKRTTDRMMAPSRRPPDSHGPSRTHEQSMVREVQFAIKGVSTVNITILS